MLTDSAPIAEQAATLEALRASVKSIQKGVNRLVPEAVRKARPCLPHPQEPLSFDLLLESCARAARHASRFNAAFEGPENESAAVAQALAEALELAEEARAGLSQQIEDIAEMATEAVGRPEERTLGALEGCVRRIIAEGDRLFTLIIAVQHHISTGGKQVSKDSLSTAKPTPGEAAAGIAHDISEIVAATRANASALQEVTQVLAATQGVNTPAAPRRGTVADRIATSLRTYGMTLSGGQTLGSNFGGIDLPQLTDILQRNFASSQEGGNRTYHFRAGPEPVKRGRDEDGLLLRGSALVNANLLKAELGALKASVDRLNSQRLYVQVPSQIALDLQLRFAKYSQGLLAVASHPLGLNTDRGKFQFQRLSNVLLEILLSGEILSGRDAEQQLMRNSAVGSADTWARLADGSGDLYELRIRISMVRSEEVHDELVGIGTLMTSIFKRVATPPRGASRGLAAARTEEYMTASHASATVALNQIERSGTDQVELELYLLPGGGAQRGNISMAQWFAWVQSLAEPFLDEDNAAAAMLVEDLITLREELKVVTAYGNGMAAAQPVSFGGVSRQFAELKYFLDEARKELEILVPSDSSVQK